MKYEIIHTSTKKFLKDHFSLTLHCSPMNADLFLDVLNKSKIFDCHSFTCYNYTNQKECEARIRIINKELDGAKISDVRMAIDKIVEKFEEAITGCLVEQGFDRDEVIKNLNELIAIQRKEIAELKSNEAVIKEIKRLEDMGVK